MNKKLLLMTISLFNLYSGEEPNNHKNIIDFVKSNRLSITTHINNQHANDIDRFYALINNINSSQQANNINQFARSKIQFLMSKFSY